MKFSDLVGIQADRLATRYGLNAIQIRYGSTIIGDSPGGRANPIVTPQGIQPDSPVPSELTLSGQGYETYDVSIPLATLLQAFGTEANAIEAMKHDNNNWYVNRGDGQGWRQCRTWGTPIYNQIKKYQITLKELGAGDYVD
jgi:hypothetical protein